MMKDERTPGQINHNEYDFKNGGAGFYTDTNTIIDQDDEVAEECQEDPYFMRQRQKQTFVQDMKEAQSNFVDM